MCNSRDWKREELQHCSLLDFPVLREWNSYSKLGAFVDACKWKIELRVSPLFRDNLGNTLQTNSSWVDDPGLYFHHYFRGCRNLGKFFVHFFLVCQFQNDCRDLLRNTEYWGNRRKLSNLKRHFLMIKCWSWSLDSNTAPPPRGGGDQQFIPLVELLPGSEWAWLYISNCSAQMNQTGNQLESVKLNTTPAIVSMAPTEPLCQTD